MFLTDTHLLGTVYDSVSHSLKHYCVECGSELFSKMTSKRLEAFSSSQEYLNVAIRYSLLQLRRKTNNEPAQITEKMIRIC